MARTRQSMKSKHVLDSSVSITVVISTCMLTILRVSFGPYLFLLVPMDSRNSTDNSNSIINNDDFYEDQREVQKIYIKLSRTRTQPVVNSSVNPPITKEYIYEWVAWDQTWVLDVWANPGILVPGFTDEGLLSNHSKYWHPTRDHLLRCIVRGRINNKSNSDASINICNGFTGLIRIENTSYLIEPVNQDIRTDSSDSSPDPGVHIFRRMSPSTLNSIRKKSEYIFNNQGGTGNSMEMASEENRSFFDNELNRQKRSISYRNTIEVMVVVDQKMIDHHDSLGGGLENYVLTLMSMTALIFRDPSFGNYVDIAVTKIVRPAGRNFSPSDMVYEATNSNQLLHIFCKRQHHYFENKNVPKYDAVMLLMRDNLCSNGKFCSTLGLATPNSMCVPGMACFLVQETGFVSAFTIAHELGHMMSLKHDDECGKSPIVFPKHKKIMQSYLSADPSPEMWSECSRIYATAFLNNKMSNCLKDDPSEPSIKPYNITGLRAIGKEYSADDQCRIKFGIDAYMYKYNCSWGLCYLQSKNYYTTMIIAEGTACAEEKGWCIHGNCVEKDDSEQQKSKIDGGWGQFGKWSACSRTCGPGVMSSKRSCDSPRPLNNGKYCLGKRYRHRTCHLTDCSEGSMDFREQQCKEFDNITTQWTPYYVNDKDSACILFCRNRRERNYVKLGDEVKDGTTCELRGHNICVKGICQPAGCDFDIDSNLKADVCGVCNGDNSTCKITNEYLENEFSEYGYANVTEIPEGSTHLKIELNFTNIGNGFDLFVFLALLDAERNSYILNGNYIIDASTKVIDSEGVILMYKRGRSNGQANETITADSPLKRTLLLQVLTSSNIPFSLHYSYNKAEKTPENYYWKMSEWTNCYEVCSDKERYPICVRNGTDDRVADAHCKHQIKPSIINGKCLEFCRSPNNRHYPIAHNNVFVGDTNSLKIDSNRSEDGHYCLNLMGVCIQIFCAEMKLEYPKAFLTLPAGPKNNFAMIYPKILSNLTSCCEPEGREKCNFNENDLPWSGQTEFDKIRLWNDNEDEIYVGTSDFTYAKTIDSSNQPNTNYGSAGDQYSSVTCPQGKFSIDLRGTDLKVSPKSEWELFGYGNNLYKKITKSKSGQEITGLCGGYYGICESKSKLVLEPVDGATKSKFTKQ